MQVIIDTAGVALKVRNRCFFVVSGEDGRMISPHRVTSILVTQDILISTAAIELAVTHEIPLFLMDHKGEIYARLWSPYFGNTAALRRKQVFFCEGEDGFDWIRELFVLKHVYQVQNLKFLSNRRVGVAAKIEEALGEMQDMVTSLETLPHGNVSLLREQLMGMEGAISKAYWQAVSSGMQDIYAFEGRSRRPAADLFNAGINYAYGMTYSWVERAVVTSGLDPYLGVLHTDNYKRPSMVFDMIEPFRPMIDRWWIELCLQKIPDLSWVATRDNGVFLEKKGKQELIPAYHLHMDSRKVMQGKTARIRDHIYAYAAGIANRIMAMEK